MNTNGTITPMSFAPPNGAPSATTPPAQEPQPIQNGDISRFMQPTSFENIDVNAALMASGQRLDDKSFLNAVTGPGQNNPNPSQPMGFPPPNGQQQQHYPQPQQPGQAFDPLTGAPIQQPPQYQPMPAMPMATQLSYQPVQQQPPQPLSYQPQPGQQQQQLTYQPQPPQIPGIPPQGMMIGGAMVTPDQIAEAIRFRSSQEFQDAVRVMKEFREDPEKFYMTYLPGTFASIKRQQAVAGGMNPEDYARGWAESELKRRYGDDFQYDPEEAMTPGSNSYKYNQDSQLLLQRGLMEYQNEVHKIQTRETQKRAEMEQAAKRVLGEFQIPEAQFERVKQIAESIPDNPEVYFRMVYTFLERLGHLAQLRSPMPITPQMQQAGQFMVHPQPMYPQPVYPQQGFPPSGYQGQPYQQTSSYQQMMAPALPMPPVSMAGSGLPGQPQDVQSSLLQMFPVDMLQINRNF